ncbi:hypothetical protein [Chroococcidiopsis sp. SAG 2025]|uniref:hypothetical protein n=1 Tax=Chroococcidiopsis sp. SAG 2025 TaxID=171389 RepID=UPI0029373A8E|nr:hypothetical protein [Chroococcidiopsis sp. SAG 2025]
MSVSLNIQQQSSRKLESRERGAGSNYKSTPHPTPHTPHPKPPTHPTPISYL